MSRLHETRYLVFQPTPFACERIVRSQQLVALLRLDLLHNPFGQVHRHMKIPKFGSLLETFGVKSARRLTQQSALYCHIVAITM